MIPRPGDMLLSYRLLEKIGEGGMGVIFKAHDTRLDRLVALKLLRPELTSDPERHRRFLREARAAAAVSHPNVTTIHQIDEADGMTFIVMELVEGTTLGSLIDGRPLPLPDALHIARLMAEGMARAHQNRVIHRDLKPDNVVIAKDGAVKILDFGLAKVLQEIEPPSAKDERAEQQVTRDVSVAGRLVGTVGYMSPEQVRGEEVDARTDIFSFGVTLYEMLTGRRPFSENSVTGTLAKILEAEPEPPRSLRPELPEELERIVLRCLRKDPAGRFTDGAELAGALGALGAVQRTAFPGAQTGTVARPAAAVSCSTLAVFPFTVRGGREFAYLGAGIVDLLSTKLDGAGDLRSVDPNVILCCTEPEEGAPDPEKASSIARRYGAGLFVLGNILEVGGQLNVDATLYDAVEGLRVESRASARGEAARIFDLVDRLTADLLARRPGGPGARLSRIAAMATDSFPALKAYLEGESHMRAFRRVAAAESYRRAVEADPGFALAWYRLGVAALWSGQSETSRAAARQAIQLSGRLSERDRSLLQAFGAALRGANDEAERRYRAIVGAYPDDVEAWYQLGEVLFHCGPQHGRSIAESREVWERLLFLEPKHINGLVHLGVIAASQGRWEDFESSVRRVMQLSPAGDAAIWIRAFWAFSRDDGAEQAALLAELRAASDYSIVFAAQFLGAYLGNPSAALRLAGLLTEPIRSPEVRAHGHAMRAHLELARGRWRAAEAELSAAQALHATAPLMYRALLAACPFAPISPDRLREILERVRSMTPEAGVARIETPAWLGPHVGLHQHLQLYLTGLLASRTGDPDEAIDCAARLEVLPGPDEAAPFIEDLARSVRAHAASESGRAGEGLSLLEGTRMQTRFDLILWSPFFSQSRERFTRAALLSQVGRLEEALAWYGAFAENSIYDQVYVAPAHFRRGEISERLRRPREAAAHYRRFLDLWRDCDPELRPVLDQAREGIERVGES